METDFFYLWLEGFAVVLLFMSIIWVWSVRLGNAGIVDPFWGLGFVLVVVFYALNIPLRHLHQWLVMVLVSLWGLRLFIYLFLRNYGKEEDYRYRQFRANYGIHRYWWVSFFQVFMLQGVLLAFISVTLLGGMYGHSVAPNSALWMVLGVLLWLIGFLFETVGDYQMAQFKKDPLSKGKVMDKGLWRYTRHPNYFGDTMVWWGYACFAIYNGLYLTIAGSLVMTFLIVKISGVAMLEKNLITRRQGYEEYMMKTSAFFPWMPKK